MTDETIHNEASMLGLGRDDSDRLVALDKTGDTPAVAWLANYKVANEKQRGTILRVLREKSK